MRSFKNFIASMYESVRMLVLPNSSIPTLLVRADRVHRRAMYGTPNILEALQDLVSQAPADVQVRLIGGALRLYSSTPEGQSWSKNAKHQIDELDHIKCSTHEYSHDWEYDHKAAVAEMEKYRS